MSYDRYTTVHHLTRDGWARGDDRPPDAIETWSCLVDQPPGWSREDRNWTCDWASPDVPRAERDKVRMEHQDKIGMTAGRFPGCRIYVGEPI